MNDIEGKVVKVIREISGIDNISLDANLLRDLDFDSLDKVDLQCELEKIFDIEIPDEEMKRLYPSIMPNSEPDKTKYATVGQIAEYVKGKLKSKVA